MPLIKLAPVIAHRGASAQAPENTLAAFTKAKQLGLRWVEFDVMLAACGEVVVIHDETVDRTTNGHGEVNAYSYLELQALDAGSWFNSNFAGEKIPTLATVIKLLHALQLSANIEIKALPDQEEQTVKNVIQVLKQHWQQDMSLPLLSTFSRPALYLIRQYAPDCLLGFLMHQWQEDWKTVCDELGCISIHVNQQILNPEKVQAFKATKRPVLTYTVDNVMRAQELFTWGVDAVFSNCPPEMLTLHRAHDD